MRTLIRRHIVDLLTFALCLIAAISLPTTGAQVRTDKSPIFLLPEHFVGFVWVYFDVPEGPPPRFEDGARVLEVPRDGWVTTRLRRTDNRAATFYYIGDNGNRTPIGSEQSAHDRAVAPDADQVLIRAKALGGEATDVLGCLVNTIVFFVGTVDDLNKKLATFSRDTEDEKAKQFVRAHPPRCARPMP